jgi:hypothetical protein
MDPMMANRCSYSPWQWKRLFKHWQRREASNGLMTNPKCSVPPRMKKSQFSMYMVPVCEQTPS